MAKGGPKAAGLARSWGVKDERPADAYGDDVHYGKANPAALTRASAVEDFLGPRSDPARWDDRSDNRDGDLYPRAKGDRSIPFPPRAAVST